MEENNNSAVNASGQSIKEIRKIIREKLTISLADYRSIVGEKKFDGRIKKTARQFGADISKALPKKKKKSKKQAENESS